MNPWSKSSKAPSILSLDSFNGSPTSQFLYQVKFLFFGMIKVRESAVQVNQYFVTKCRQARHPILQNSWLKVFFLSLGKQIGSWLSPFQKKLTGKQLHVLTH